jgi:hypothetical protein
MQQENDLLDARIFCDWFRQFLFSSMCRSRREVFLLKEDGKIGWQHAPTIKISMYFFALMPPRRMNSVRTAFTVSCSYEPTDKTSPPSLGHFSVRGDLAYLPSVSVSDIRIFCFAESITFIKLVRISARILIASFVWQSPSVTPRTYSSP